MVYRASGHNHVSMILLYICRDIRVKGGLKAWHVLASFEPIIAVKALLLTPGFWRPRPIAEQFWWQLEIH